MVSLRIIMSRKKSGFTLIELLVVIAIIAILIGLLLPAVQKVREAAARAKCSNNLKQLGLALVSYHDTYNSFSHGGIGSTGPMVAGEPIHGFGIMILPQIEQESLFKRYDFAKNWYDTTINANGFKNSDIAATVLKTFECPSAGRNGAVPYTTSSSSNSVNVTAAPSDYGPVSYIDSTLRNAVPAILPASFITNYKGVLRSFSSNKISGVKITQITDGTSNTLMLVEDVGRPLRFRMGAPVPTSVSSGASWADRDNSFSVAGFDKSAPTKSPMFGTCAVNCSNNNEAYSFHSGGVTSVFADGSVHFINQNISILNFASLVTLDGGEIVSTSDFN